MDTASIILAVASPPGRSLRGIVRMSGPGAIEFFHEAAIPKRAATVRERSAQRIALQLLAAPLPALALQFPGPRAYTGEDSIEIQLPGNPALLERVIDALIARGGAHNFDVRRAEPGEFTARAFFNGRISLTEAEGVAATIAARSDAELRAAHMLTGGRLGGLAETLADELATVLALVEAGIDFTDEEDVVAIARDELLERTNRLCDSIAELLGRATGAEALHAIASVVLIGEPNAGKSTLFNALLGHERAVVSPLAGTTRDVIAEPLRIDTPHGHAEVMLIDLAGLDPAQDAMNVQMQSRAREAIGRADLVVRCVPADQTFEIPDSDSGIELIVRTKNDLEAAVHPAGLAAEPASRGTLSVCAISGAGLDELRAAMADRLADRAVSVAADALVLNARHFDALRSAADNLADAAHQAAPEPGHDHRLRHPELVAAALRAALDNLGSLAGRITPDDILGRVFATFCIGK